MNTTAFTIFDASAGSGKTYTLTKEYLKILLLASNDDAYKKILAITFTNKAVNEMKARIVTSLYEFSSDTTSEKAMELLKEIAVETKLSCHFSTENCILPLSNLSFCHNTAISLSHLSTVAYLSQPDLDMVRFFALTFG